MTQGEQWEATCRICLESSPVLCSDDAVVLSEDRLISPCACSGTQAFVHAKCLTKWQNAVMTSRRPGARHSAALICTVCTQKFSITPSETGFPSHISKIFSSYSCELTCLFCVLCACYLALAGLNLQTISDQLESSIAMAREILPCSFNIMKEACLSWTCSLLGGKLGYGHPSLHPGTLLVATAAMPSPFFFGSVVLLYDHRRCSASRGLILNMPVEDERIFDWETKALPSIHNNVLLKRLGHGLGGPIAQHDWMILHRCICCASSPLKHSCSLPLGKEKPFSMDWGRELLPGIYLGRDISPMLQYAKEESPMLPRQVLHGHAEWFVGQLGSEVKRGYWLTKPNASEVLLATPPQELWHALIKD
eukprot:Gb_21776 [translate_table: standard]